MKTKILTQSPGRGHTCIINDFLSAVSTEILTTVKQHIFKNGKLRNKMDLLLLACY